MLLRLSLPLLLALPALAQDDEPPTPPQRGGADPSEDAFEMGSPAALAEGVTEEEIWPAATAEGWKKPVLIKWQRTFQDALRVARTENRPIMVAVNMDGEIASEHFAGIRYRSVETGEMMSKYACVIASVYRHTPRDYDENGNRVPCPRFGTVTCGEHIECERQLYDKYFEGRRISPRHIVLDLEEKEVQDVYYSWDTQSVIKSFVKGVEGWPEPDELLEPTLEQLVGSARVEHREEAERRYREGDAAARRELLRAILEHRVVDQTEVLRQAIFGFDLEAAKLARRALAQSDTDGALDLIADALKTPLDPEERQLLLDAVERMAATLPRARTLAALHSGLSVESSRVAVDGAALAEAYGASARGGVDVAAREEAATGRPNDPAALSDFALALLEQSLTAPDERFAELLRADAREALDDATTAGAEGPRVEAARALLADQAGRWRQAGRAAVAAAEGGVLRLDAEAAAEDALGPASRKQLLRLFARSRGGDIRRAYRVGSEWPGDWLSDVNAAYEALAAAAPEAPDVLVEHHDFLRWIGASPRADRVLEQALVRFPDAPVLHERLRGRLLWSGGPKGLEEGYRRRLEAAPADDTSQLTWFAGYASLVAAEHHRRRNELAEALAAYDRAGAQFQRNAEVHPAGADNCEHFLVLGLAGKARVALEQGELAAATTDLLAALRRRPASAATPDGLSFSPMMTAKMVYQHWLDAGDEARADEVWDAMASLPPEVHAVPMNEMPQPREERDR